MVAVRNVFGIRQSIVRQQPNERLVLIGLSVAGDDLFREGGFFRFCHKRLRGGQIKGAQNAAGDRGKMRGELHRNGSAGGRRKLLFHLGKVAMLGDAVGLEAFVTLGVEEWNVGLAAGPTHATLAVGNDAGGLD